MTATLTIRPEPPDQPDVLRLIEALDAQMTALYPPESNHLLDIAALSAPMVTFLVVRDERMAIGCGALKRDARGWGEVKRMYVRPDRRGRGIGKRVLAELEAIARNARLPLLRLETGNPQSRCARALSACEVCRMRGFWGLRAGPVECFHGEACRTVGWVSAQRVTHRLRRITPSANPPYEGRGACRAICRSMT